MNTAEIKIDLFRKLDSLQDEKLEEAYGLLINFINGSAGTGDRQNLSPEQHAAIQVGITQLNNGEGKIHNDVMSRLKARFLNE